MRLAHAVHTAVMVADRLLSKIQIRCRERRGCLINLYFHSLFLDEAEIRKESVYPQQGTTVNQFRELLKYFIDSGFTFISPEDCLRPLDVNGRYALVSFDDGYFNNSRALPVLEELNVSATFFISAQHVALGKPYWWDVLFRKMRSLGHPAAKVCVEAARFQASKRTQDIEAEIARRFGNGGPKTIGDLDRPFTPEELHKFSQNPRVAIGNHTFNHAVLPNYSAEEARFEITEAQKLLHEITGRTPLAIAYPNGGFNRETVKIAREAGLKLGFSTVPRKQYLPRALSGDNAMVLGRFCPVGGESTSVQGDYFRSDLMLHERYQAAKQMLKTAWRRRIA